MINLLFRNIARFSGKFKIESYTKEDYATMCGLLRQNYQLHNEQIQTSGVVKLIDDTGRAIGIYSASEARKKAEATSLDIVLVNQKTMPIICKLTDFRKKMINRFYQQIVAKSHKDVETRANEVKSIKIAPTLNKNENIVKIKQILSLSQKFAKIRVFMTSQQSQREESLSKLEEIKSQLMNKCYIDEQISQGRSDEEEDEINPRRRETYSFLLRAKETDLKSKAVESKKQDPDVATKNFLKKYYSQDDGEMMDLKSAGVFEIDAGYIVDENELVIEEDEDEFNKRQIEMSFVQESHARILNQRLKVLLSLAK